jgi:hypothetical protein
MHLIEFALLFLAGWRVDDLVARAKRVPHEDNFTELRLRNTDFEIDLAL